MFKTLKTVLVVQLALYSFYITKLFFSTCIKITSKIKVVLTNYPSNMSCKNLSAYDYYYVII